MTVVHLQVTGELTLYKQMANNIDLLNELKEFTLAIVRHIQH